MSEAQRPEGRYYLTRAGKGYFRAAGVEETERGRRVPWEFWASEACAASWYPTIGRARREQARLRRMGIEARIVDEEGRDADGRHEGDEPSPGAAGNRGDTV